MNKSVTRIVTLIFLCAIIVRAVGIPSFFFSPDELMHLGVSQGNSILEVLRRSTVEVHPPLEQFMKSLILATTDNVLVLRTACCFLGLLALCALSLAAYAAAGLSAGLSCFAMAAFVPAFVSMSLLVRGYGLFVLTISLAIREFFILLKTPSPQMTSRAWLLATWLLLACATNFAGFPFALTILFSLSWLHVTNRRRTNLIFIFTIAAAIALEGAGLWWWYFSPETGATEWRMLSKSSYFEQCAGFQVLAVWLLRVLTLFVPLPLHVLPSEIFIVVGAAMVVFYLYTLARLRTEHHELVVFACVAWVISITLNFAGVYPLVGPRHSIYLLPVILIPLSVVLGPFVLTFPRVTASIVVAITISSLNGGYFSKSNDFPLPLRNYEAAKEFLTREVASEDVILTSRFGLLYVLYEKDGLQTFYEPSESIYTTSFVGHRVVASTPGRRWQLIQEDVSPLLSELHGTSPTGARIWLLSLGFKDHVMERMRRCADERHIYLRTMDIPGVSIVGINSEDFKRLFESSSECFADYRENLCAEKV